MKNKKETYKSKRIPQWPPIRKYKIILSKRIQKCQPSRVHLDLSPKEVDVLLNMWSKPIQEASQFDMKTLRRMARKHLVWMNEQRLRKSSRKTLLVGFVYIGWQKAKRLVNGYKLKPRSKPRLFVNKSR